MKLIKIELPYMIYFSKKKKRKGNKKKNLYDLL